jgi:glucan phosphoethanolaminetransferase (alkaline phosphatase superfamily)
MIQRIQTVFLFLSIVAVVAMLFAPLWTKTNLQTGDLAQLTPTALTYTRQTAVVSQQSTIYIAVLAFVSITFAFLSIFTYKNRMRQVLYNLLNILVLIAILGCLIYFSAKGEKFFSEPAQGNFGLGYFMPAIAVLMNSLANRFIRRDEKLVKSVDRLR